MSIPGTGIYNRTYSKSAQKNVQAPGSSIPQSVRSGGTNQSVARGIAYFVVALVIYALLSALRHL